MQINKLIVPVFSLFIGALSSSNEASTININQDVDLSSFSLPSSGGILETYINSAYPSDITVVVGDMVNLHYTFLKGQSLKIDTDETGYSYITGWLMHNGSNDPAGDNSSEFTASGTISFDNLVGGLNAPTSIVQSDGMAHVGLYYQELIAPNSSIQFSGYKVSFTVQDFTNGYMSHVYSGPWLNIGGASVSVVATPLPGAVWVFGSGLLCLVGLAGRRKAG